MERVESIIKTGRSKLNNFQSKILTECIRKGSGGMSLPMGTGKTLLSLVLIHELKKRSGNMNPALIVCAKSLIANWETEIKKFFNDQINYLVLHTNNKDISIPLLSLNDDKYKDLDIILTTSEVLSKAYKNKNIRNQFIEQHYLRHNFNYENYYTFVSKPFLTHKRGDGILYSYTWCCLVVDEAQNYTNINTMKSQSICSIHASNRWLLSGTMFDEPTIERILGYYLMLGEADVPRTIPDMAIHVKSRYFRGMSRTLVSRKENTEYKPPIIEHEIVSHTLQREEEIVYTLMKNILVQINKRTMHARIHGNVDDYKKYSTYRLVMIMYLRQALVCSLLPLTSISIDAANVRKKNELSDIVIDEMKKVGLEMYLNNPDSMLSSRAKSVLEKINKHKEERIVLFSCFVSFIEILKEYLPMDRKIYRLTSTMSTKKRGDVIKEFSDSDNGILLLTYQIGAEGLNLQKASVVMIVDFWWNAAKTQQAMARVLRYGQEALRVFVYMFTSNTGIENIIFNKQNAKLIILEELKHGAIKKSSTVPKLNINQVIQLIAMSDNRNVLNKIY